jgi:hypothetical protein
MIDRVRLVLNRPLAGNLDGDIEGRLFTAKVLPCEVNSTLLDSLLPCIMRAAYPGSLVGLLPQLSPGPQNF